MNKKNVEYLCHFLDYFLNISSFFFFFFFKGNQVVRFVLKRKEMKILFTHRLLTQTHKLASNNTHRFPIHQVKLHVFINKCDHRIFHFHT